MFNAEKPSLEDLPSSAHLLRSTVIAGVSAVAILVTVVLPAEYGVDPTRIGGVLGLTEMGEIKNQLAEEAEMDRQMEAANDDQSSLLNDIFGLFVGAAHAQEQEVWQDMLTFTLAPDASAEIKMEMTDGAIADYAWVAEGGRINFDLHAHGGGQSIDYDRGRGATSGEGSIEAAFDGDHGWFWRNRDSADVTVTLQLRGAYGEVVETY
ncbi:MAG: transmembrane anchor protein [Loktanella sp.]|nr:transmembrane anchor protein [Loktanella sp.]